MKRDDRRLIDAFQSGDQGAFDELFQRYAPRVLAFTFQITNDASEAEDLTQEVFIGAYRGRQGFRGQANVLTWLFAIAVRRWRDKQRASRPSTASLSPEDLAGGSVRGSPDYLKPAHTEELLDLESAISCLTEPLREAFVLVVVQERTYREAAAIIGCPAGTLKSRVATALRQVRTLLREDNHVTCLLP